MSLLDVQKMFEIETSEKNNMGQEDMIPVTIDNTNITGFCPNCNKKNNKANNFCDKDCETSYMIEKTLKKNKYQN